MFSYLNVEFEIMKLIEAESRVVAARSGGKGWKEERRGYWSKGT